MEAEVNQLQLKADASANLNNLQIPASGSTNSNYQSHDEWDNYLDNSNDFLKDKCIAERSDAPYFKQIVAHLQLASQEATAVESMFVRKALQHEYTELIKKYEREIEISEMKPPKCSQDLTWDLLTYEDWLKEHINHKHFGTEGAEAWQNFFVKHIDYIAQPSIKVKNKEILAFFSENYFTQIEQNHELFSEIKDKIMILLKECYQINNHDQISKFT